MPAAVAGSYKTVGSPHWTSGPVAIVPDSLHGSWATDFTAPDGKALTKLKKRVVKATSKGIEGLFFPHFLGGCYRDKQTVVLVSARDTTGRMPENLEAVLKAAKQVDVEDGQWKRVMTYTPETRHVLCDAWAKDIGGEAKRDRKKKIDLELAMEEYIVEEVRDVPHSVKPFPNKKPIDVKYSFTRLRPAKAIVANKAAKKSDAPVASELVATPEIIAAGKKLKFVDNDQTASVIMGRNVLKAWGGLDENEDGSTDYGRACAVNGVGLIDVGSRDALVIGMDSSMSWYSQKGGGTILLWVGADSATGVLATVLSIPENKWKKTKTRWNVGDGKLVLLGAPTNGAKAGKAKLELALAPGTYAIETCWRFEATVRVGKKIEDTMVAAIRLVRD